MCVQELTAANAHRLSGASPATLAALLQAGALRGWGHHEPRAWEALTQALDAHTRAVEADVRDLPLVSKVRAGGGWLGERGRFADVALQPAPWWHCVVAPQP